MDEDRGDQPKELSAAQQEVGLRAKRDQSANVAQAKKVGDKATTGNEDHQQVDQDVDDQNDIGKRYRTAEDSIDKMLLTPLSLFFQLLFK